MSPTILQIDDFLFTCARRIIEDMGVEHVPLIMAFPRDQAVPQTIPVATRMVDEAGKESVARLINRLMETGEYDVVAFISEGWQAAVSSEEAARAVPGTATNHPGREEVLAVSYSLRGGERASATHRILADKVSPRSRKLERGKLLIGADHISGRFFAGEAV